MTAGFADGWAEAMWRASWQGGIALALAWALTRALPKLPAAAKCCVWRVAYLKLLVCLAWAAPVELPVLRPVIQEPAPPVDMVFTQPPAPSGDVPAAARGEFAITPAPRPRLPTLLFVAWAAGMSLSAFRLLSGWRQAARLRRRCRAVENRELLDLFDSLCRQLVLASPPRLMTADGVKGPLLLGPLRPVIVLPADATRHYTPDALRLMFAHELAHLRRGDLWWNWLPALAEVVFFFHPLVWVAGREWRLAQESACDEAAVRAASATPAQFGRMLLDVLTLAPTSREESPFPPRSLPATAAAGVFEPRSSLNRRLSAMRHFRTHRPPLTRHGRIIIALFLALTSTAALVPWRLVAQTPDVEVDRTDQPADDATPAAEPVAADPAAPDGAERSVTERGFIKVPQVNLAVPQSGIVTEVRVKPGDAVKAGQVLVELDSRELQIKLRAAATKVQRARVEVERARQLRDRKNATEAEVAAIEASLQGTEAEVNLVEHQLQQTRVVAPFAGVVSDVRAVPGMMAGPDKELVTVVDLSKPSFDVHVPYSVATQLRVGQRVRVTVIHQPKRTYAAAISFISPTLRAGSQTVLIRADLLEGRGEVPAGIEGVMEIQLPKRDK